MTPSGGGAPASPNPGLEPPSPGGRLILASVGLGTFLSAISGSTINLALPALGKELHLSVGESSGVILSFLLAIGIALIPAGRIGDMFGHRRGYLAGFLLFGVGSIGAGVAWGYASLLASRVLQGIGGAMALATSTAILTTSFHESRRGGALGLLGSATYAGLTLGPPVGGLILWLGDWRWTFLMNVPACAAILWMGARCLPRDPERKPAGFDLAGTAADFLGLFRSRVFAGAAASALCNYAGLFGAIFLLPFYLIEGLGKSPRESGFLLMAQPIVMALVAFPAGRLSDRIGTRGLATGGMLVLAAGLAGLSTLGPDARTPAVASWLAVMGLGMGTFVSPNSSTLMGASPRDRQGAAGSVLAEARILGMLIGVALAASIFHAAGGHTERPEGALPAGPSWTGVEFAAMRLALLAGALITIAGAVFAGLRPKAP